MPPRPVETVLASAAASFIAAQTLTYLDGGAPETVNGLATIALPEAAAVYAQLMPHEGCGCVEPVVELEPELPESGEMAEAGEMAVAASTTYAVVA
jgi:hypothetical protein